VHVPAELVGYGDTGEDPHPDCLLDWPSAIAGGLEIIAESLACCGEASRAQQSYSSPSGPDLS